MPRKIRRLAAGDEPVQRIAASGDAALADSQLAQGGEAGLREGRELLLYSIGVRAGARRQGVGAALVQEMLAWMRRAGVPEVWVLADNPGAEAFYSACGFTRGGENDQGVLMLRNAGPD